MARAAIARFVAYFPRPQLLRPLLLNFFQSMVDCLFCFLSCTLQTYNVFLQLVIFYHNIRFYLTSNPTTHSKENFHTVRLDLKSIFIPWQLQQAGPSIQPDCIPSHLNGNKPKPWSCPDLHIPGQLFRPRSS